MRLDRWPALEGLDAVHTMLDGSRETLNATVAKIQVVASNPEMTAAKRALCWMLAGVTAGCCDSVVGPIVIDATAIDDDRQLQPNYRNCDCRANWPMVMPTDAYCGRCNLRNRATSILPLCMAAVDRVLVHMTSVQAYSMRPMLVVAFSGYRMRPRRLPVVVALATNNEFWTNSNDVHNEIHSLTCQPIDICADDMLCMRYDFSYWLYIRRYSYILILTINCCTSAQRMTEKKMKE